ncbi:MAG: NADH-quinone oxidoreductase subunit J [Acidobacteriota bacterium]
MILTGLFFAFALIAFVSSLYLVFHPKTIPASLGMAGSMVAIGMIYALLRFPFFAFIQIILYAGAVMVMVVYLVMSQGFEEIGKEASLSQTIGAYVISVLFLFSFSRVVSKSLLPAWEKAEKGFGSIREIGLNLVKDYAVPFEILSIILVAAMAGSVLLSKRSLK